MNGIFSALIAAGLILSSPAKSETFVADDSGIERVTNVCENEFKTVAQLAACWEANGSSSKQFGSEGGSDSGESGEGEGGGAAE